MKEILIIEDDPQFQRMLFDLLKIEGYQVYTANNGKEGISQFKKHKPDLVISDIIMPEKEGTETIIELKTIFPDIKIIAVSGGGRTSYIDYLQTVKEFGVDATFSKPFNHKDFLQTIRKILNL